MISRSLRRYDRALRALLATGAAALTLGPAACGGSPTAPQAPASSASPPAALLLPPAPDLSAVAPPPGLVVSGTLSKLGASLATVHGWSQLPMPQAEQVTELLADENLGPLADLDRPIDLAVAVSGSGSQLSSAVAVSAGVRDIDAAKAALADHYKLVPAANGALLIQSLKQKPHPAEDSDDDRSSDDDGHSCELAPAYGASAFRLVCGWDPKALAALAPWLTRGATRENSTFDAHVEVHVGPLKPTLNEERRLFSMLVGTILGGRLGISAARGLAQAVGGDLMDFGSDLDTATLDVALSDPGAAATLTIKLSGAASTLGRIATANADRNGPPPAAFWQMPGDADFAVFDRGIDPAAVARGRDLVLKVLADGLAEDGVKDADRNALVDALGKLVTPAAAVYASGVDVEAARKAMAAEKSLPDTADVGARREANRAAAQALLGWRVLEIDEPATSRIDALKGIAAALARPALFAVYHTKPGSRAVGIRASALPKGSTLPAGSAHFAIDIPLPDPVEGAAKDKASGKGAGPAKPLGVDVFVVPDGARSWIGIGCDTARISAKLASAVAGTGDVLGARPELAAMKDSIVGAGGFFTARGVPEIGVQAEAFGAGDPGGFGNGAELFEGSTQLPHQGTTPIPFSLTAPVTTPGTVVAQLQVSRGTIDDIVVTVLKHGF